MSKYRTEIENPIPLVLLIPTYKNEYGVNNKTYPSIEQALSEKDDNNEPINLFYGSFKTYGGNEREINGVYAVEDTAKIKTWYRPDIKSNCGIGVTYSGGIYEILGEPEDIDMRHQFLEFKVRRYKGQS